IKQEAAVPVSFFMRFFPSYLVLIIHKNGRQGGRILHRYRRIVNLCVFILITVAAFNTTDYNPFMENEVEKMSQSIIEVANTNNHLYKEIQQKKDEYAEAPENAVIDKVWKKTPGRNGIKVDVEESYEQMKEEGEFDESLLVFEEIPPEKTFADLPAAPVYRGHPEKEMVAFLINVSWGTEYIPDILTILKEQN